MRRLPPFAPLVAFEAVARLASFTRAGAELGLTQSAVSHRVRALEARFGVRLIERLNPGLRLTPEGAALLPRLAQALDLLAGLGHPGAAPAPRPVRLGAASALATWWLARRLPRFAALRPDIPLEIVPFENRDEAERAAVDVRVLWVSVAEATVSPAQRPLFRETVFPVCRPSLLPHRRPLADGGGLRTLPLIHKGSQEGADDRGDPAGSEWQWSTWLGGWPSEAVPSAPRGGLRFRDIGAALAAAVEGAGVALGRSLLVHDAIADGRLVRALPADRALPSTKVHVARWPAALTGDPRVTAVVEWLAQEAAVTVGRLDAAGPGSLA